MRFNAKIKKIFSDIWVCENVVYSLFQLSNLPNHPTMSPTNPLIFASLGWLRCVRACFIPQFQVLYLLCGWYHAMGSSEMLKPRDICNEFAIHVGFVRGPTSGRLSHFRAREHTNSHKLRIYYNLMNKRQGWVVHRTVGLECDASKLYWNGILEGNLSAGLVYNDTHSVPLLCYRGDGNVLE